MPHLELPTFWFWSKVCQIAETRHENGTVSFAGELRLTFSKIFRVSSCSVFWHLLRNVLLCNTGI